MIADNDIPEQTGKLSIPWDITEWLDKSSLLTHIAEDIDSLDWKNPELVEFLRTNPNFQARFLLILITYAYTMGICESEDVAELCFGDAELKRWVPARPPSPAAITRFRRENRGLLKWSVGQAIKHALRRRFELGDAPLPPGFKRLIIDAATSRIDVGRHMDRSVQAE
jgi:hypothetical protein